MSAPSEAALASGGTLSSVQHALEGECVSVVCAVVPVAERMFLSLRQRRQLRGVDVDRVLTTVGFIQFNQSAFFWPFTIHLFFFFFFFRKHKCVL